MDSVLLPSSLPMEQVIKKYKAKQEDIRKGTQLVGDITLRISNWIVGMLKVSQSYVVFHRNICISGHMIRYWIV